jgi:hypothetical protein
MAITDDLRKTFSDPTPFYFAAGTADLAVQQARKVPALLEQFAAEAPERIEELRGTDPRAVPEKVFVQAREAQATVQARVGEVIGGFDTDLRKLGETAQDLALRGVGIAAEYAVKARETYERVAEHGEHAVRQWRGEAAEEITEIVVAVEPRTEPRTTPRTAAAGAEARPGARTAARPARTEPKDRPKTAQTRTAKPAEAKTGEAKARKTPPAPRRAPAARKPAAKKTPPPAK